MALIKDDSDKFEKYQDAFLHELVGIVRFALADAGIPHAQAKDVTADVTFAVASFLDGGGDYCFIKDDEFRPHLAFERKDEPNVLYCSSGGAMHETVEDHVDYAYRHSLGV
jgi:hypothetical protein